jgi:hypothetical protein
MFFNGNGSAFGWFRISHALAYAKNLFKRLIVAAYASGTCRPGTRNNLIGFAIHRNIAMCLAIIA